jgi:hypothetical protein
MFRAIVFFALVTSAFACATLDVLVNAAASFSATIQQQLEMLQSNLAPVELAEKTIDYAQAKEAYFKALREDLPELMRIAMGKEARPPSLGRIEVAFYAMTSKICTYCDEPDTTVGHVPPPEPLLRSRR